MKNVFRILLLAPFLLATTCDLESTRFYNDYRVKVTPQATFNAGDIIWAEGRTSTKGYDSEARDSVFIDTDYFRAHFSVFRLVTGQQANAIDGLPDFETIPDIGTIVSECETSDVRITPEITPNGTLFKYKIGLKALTPGDYVLTWNPDSYLLNPENNALIYTPYQYHNKPNKIRYRSCNFATLGNLRQEADRVYFFTVE